ncbi:MAG: hypothetical protein R3E08_13555 [Thiotrichaceae bacterium]
MMTKELLKTEIDQVDTQIDFSQFVETNITAIHIIKTAQEHDVSISILDHEQNHWVLTAYSVTAFSLDRLCSSNIIDWIRLLDESNTNLEELRNTIFTLFSSEYTNNNKYIAWQLVDKVIDEIRNSERIVLEIEPVAGAYILLIAENVSLTTESV